MTDSARNECDHGVTFDEEAAKALYAATVPPIDTDPAVAFVMGNSASGEVRKRWPRGFFSADNPCPKGCGFVGIAYASYAHYTYGDW